MSFIGRLTAAVSAAVMAFSAALCPVSASDFSSASVTYYYHGVNQEAEKYIASELEKYSAQIDVYRFGLTFGELEELLSDVILSRPDIFYIEPQFSYAADASGIIAAVRPKYYYSQRSVASGRAEMEKAADEIISGTDSKWSDIQKALYVHDMLAVNTAYDVDNEVRSAYEVLVGKSGLCVAYAMAYKYIMDRIGIECIIVMNSDINHSWNMVRINNKWYHVDVTWDDTVPNFEGLVYHDYFLVSDSVIKSGRNPHTGNTTHSYPAPDTSYDDMFWHSSAAQLIPSDGNKWFYMDNAGGKFCIWDWKSSKSTELKKIGMGWFSDSSRENYWLYCYSRLDRQGNTIFFNSPNAVWAYDIKSGKFEVVKRYSLSGSTAIYGLHTKDGKVLINTAESPTDKKFRTYAAFTLSYGTDEQTNNISHDAPADDGIRILPPQNVTCRPAGTSGVVVLWDETEGADAYSVYEYFPDRNKILLRGSTSSLRFIDRNVSSGVHCYAVKAYKKIGGKMYYSKCSVIVTVEL